ncbi:hypothetical protein V1509DRAFT_668033 [Lipomyces kononenkoae]
MKVKFQYDHSDLALYPAFVSQLIAKLRIDGHLIGGEAEQVWFAFGCLQGIAKARIHPWMKAYEGNAQKFTRDEFVLQMQRSFFDPEARNKALQKLGYLSFRGGDLSEFSPQWGYPAREVTWSLEIGPSSSQVGGDLANIRFSCADPLSGFAVFPALRGPERWSRVCCV